jgi:hypothetical protein
VETHAGGGEDSLVSKPAAIPEKYRQVTPGPAAAIRLNSAHSRDSEFRAPRRAAHTAPDRRDASTGAMLPVVSIGCGGPCLVEVEGEVWRANVSAWDVRACGRLS